MNSIGYIVVFLATAYSAISIFGLGWSSEPASFVNQLLKVGLTTSVAGAIAAIPKKAELKMVVISAASIPALVLILMTQGIIQNRAFYQLYWIAIPAGGTALAIIAFILTKRVRSRNQIKADF